MEKRRYSYKYKFITSQPDKYGEYYVYRFEKINKEAEKCIVYKMKGTKINPFTSFTMQHGDYYAFKDIQELIEGRRFD